MSLGRIARSQESITSSPQEILLLKCCNNLQHVHVEQPGFEILLLSCEGMWRDYGVGVKFSIEIPKCKILEHHNIEVSRSRLELSWLPWLLVVSTFFPGLVSSSSLRMSSNRNFWNTPVCWIPNSRMSLVPQLKTGKPQAPQKTNCKIRKFNSLQLRLPENGRGEPCGMCTTTWDLVELSPLDSPGISWVSLSCFDHWRQRFLSTPQWICWVTWSHLLQRGWAQAPARCQHSDNGTTSMQPACRYWRSI